MADELEFGGTAGYPQGSCALLCCNSVASFLLDAGRSVCSLCRLLRKQLKLVWGQRESRRLFVFILIMYVFLGLEATYGYFTTSLGMYHFIDAKLISCCCSFNSASILHKHKCRCSVCRSAWIFVHEEQKISSFHIRASVFAFLVK